MNKGASALSNAELIAILIGSGTRKQTAVELARDILQKNDNELSTLGRATLADLKRFPGMGDAKSVAVLAALELARRRRAEEARHKTSMSNSRDVYEHFLQHMGDLAHEEFWAMFLTRQNQVIAVKRISEGGISSTLVDPKKVFNAALESKASFVIAAHNHPSGNLKASSEDVKLTSKLRKAGHLLDLPLLDHLIIATHGYFSFADEGMLDNE